MSSAKIASNGMINLPVKIREKLGVKPGDRVSFVETDDGIVIVPIKNAFDLIDPNIMDETKELIEELHEERKNEEW